MAGVLLLRASNGGATASRGSSSRPCLDRQRTGDHQNSEHPPGFALKAGSLACDRTAGNYPAGFGSTPYRHFVRVVRRIYGCLVSRPSKPLSSCRDFERSGAEVWMAQILTCCAAERSAHLGHARTSDTPSSDACLDPLCFCRYCHGMELASLCSDAGLGLLRPSELIGLRRQDLSLPMDHWDGNVVYLRVSHPKTRFRAAQAQHVRIDEDGIGVWVQAILGSIPMWRKLWCGSLAS